jgi:hypothetical protein
MSALARNPRVTFRRGELVRMLYKYFSSEVLELVFDRDGFCGVKCSYPQDYNDPYELFLEPDS